MVSFWQFDSFGSIVTHVALLHRALTELSGEHRIQQTHDVADRLGLDLFRQSRCQGLILGFVDFTDLKVAEIWNQVFSDGRAICGVRASFDAQPPG